jgi:hypothetical protein
VIAAIHQPNFFPWLGYFRKIARADKFIFLDCVQYSKGSWTNRVRLLIAGEARWVTCPLEKPHGRQAISTVLINDKEPWRKKIKRTLAVNYGNSPHFCEVFPLVESLIDCPTRSISAFNINSIECLCEKLGIGGELCLASAHLPGYDSAAADRDETGSALLAELTATVGADVYLAGDGAGGYERPEEYERRGIRLQRNGFMCQPYQQNTGAFIAGLSVLDALFYIGFKGVRSLLAGD